MQHRPAWAAHRHVVGLYLLPESSVGRKGVAVTDEDARSDERMVLRLVRTERRLELTERRLELLEEKVDLIEQALDLLRGASESG